MEFLFCNAKRTRLIVMGWRRYRTVDGWENAHVCAIKLFVFCFVFSLLAGIFGTEERKAFIFCLCKCAYLVIWQSFTMFDLAIIIGFDSFWCQKSISCKSINFGVLNKCVHDLSHAYVSTSAINNEKVRYF